MKQLELEILSKQVGARITNLHMLPTIVERIKVAQLDDIGIQEIKKRIEISKAMQFHIDNEGVLGYK